MITDLLLARAALRDTFRPKRLLTVILMILLAPTAGLFWKLAARTGPQADPANAYDQMVVYILFGFTLTILAVLYGTGVVSQEMEQRTIVYLLTRPLPRWRILLARHVVSVLVVAAVTTISTLLLALVVFGPSQFADAGVGPDIRAICIGALAYGSLFLLAGVLLPRPLVYSLLFVFGWEAISLILPGSFARLSIITYLRVLAARDIAPDPNAADEGSSGGNPAQQLLAPTHADPLAISHTQAWVVLTLTSLVLMVAAMIIFSQKEYTPREDD